MPINNYTTIPILYKIRYEQFNYLTGHLNEFNQICIFSLIKTWAGPGHKSQALKGKTSSYSAYCASVLVAIQSGSFNCCFNLIFNY